MDIASNAAIRRMPMYLHYLKLLLEQGGEVVSSAQLAEELKLDATQVRKDLALTGAVGRPRVGYCVKELIEAIEAFLGWNQASEAFLVGAGNLGRALLGYAGFEQYGLKILAAFDSDPKLVGTEVSGKPVYSLAKLSNLTRRMRVRIGIIAVPASAAQSVAERMVEAGMEAIWNFAPTALNVPNDIVVEHTQLYETFAALSHRLAAQSCPVSAER